MLFGYPNIMEYITVNSSDENCVYDGLQVHPYLISQHPKSLEGVIKKSNHYFNLQAIYFLHTAIDS